MAMARIACSIVVLALALLITPRTAGAVPNANCKPNRASCTASRQCCSGLCGLDGLCATPPTTTSPSTTTTSSTSTTSTTTSSTTTTTLRFVDNGDGTVTDNQTGLQWEQKTDDGTVHDKDNTYSWCVGTFPNCNDSSNPPDGTAFTSFLATLNRGATGVGNCVSSDGSTQTGGFDNHCDWRLPTIAELRTIMDTGVAGCGSGNPCIDQTVFGPTVASSYWSATTYAPSPGVAWDVGFNDGGVYADFKFLDYYVRAVRSGP